MLLRARVSVRSSDRFHPTWNASKHRQNSRLKRPSVNSSVFRPSAQATRALARVFSESSEVVNLQRVPTESPSDGHDTQASTVCLTWATKRYCRSVPTECSSEPNVSSSVCLSRAQTTDAMLSRNASERAIYHIDLTIVPNLTFSCFHSLFSL